MAWVLLSAIPARGRGQGGLPPNPSLEPGTEGCLKVHKGRRCWLGRVWPGRASMVRRWPPGGWAGEGGWWRRTTAGQGGVKASTAPGAGGGQAGSR